ncbi:MAG: polyamine aminopropyltransferase [Elusimicrobia bacterium]|nr:polyamine aminopropyltransferase [Elusimicrobiota bacterium]
MTSALPAERWVEEIQDGAYGMKWRVKDVLFQGKSAFQSVEVVETVSHGRMLLIDGLLMTSERDEFVYHEMIAHVPLTLHPAPRRVLVIGGGDGGTVREALKHPTVETVVLVEIDGMVVDAARRFLPGTASALEDKRVEVRIEDGVKYMAAPGEPFDAVLVDSTDPFGAAAPLFGPAFYADVKRRLTAEGLVVAQAENPFYKLDEQRGLLRVVRGAFGSASLYNYHNLTYPGGLWSFAAASKRPRDLSVPDEARVAALQPRLRYYNAGIHRAAFALPEFMKRGLVAD